MTHSNSNPSSLPKRIRSQFATYRIAISRVAIATTFLVISFLAVLPGVSRAQCPPGWATYGEFPVNIAGTSCTVNVYTCVGYDSITHVEEIEPYLIAEDTPWTCDSIPWNTIIQEALDSFPGVAIAGFPNCGSGSYEILEMYAANCWSYQLIHYSHGVEVQEFLPCLAAEYCVKQCQYCVDPVSGYVQISSCAYWTINAGGCSDAIPAGPGGPSVPATCYLLGLCGTDW
jgi:hypothetical protein